MEERQKDLKFRLALALTSCITADTVACSLYLGGQDASQFCPITKPGVT